MTKEEKISYILSRVLDGDFKNNRYIIEFLNSCSESEIDEEMESLE